MESAPKIETSVTGGLELSNLGDWYWAKSIADASDDENLSFHLSGMIANHRRKLGRVGKIETLPIPQICPRPTQTTGDKSGESIAFPFSRRVPDFCDSRRSFPTNENSNLYRRGRRRWISFSTNPPNCWAPVPPSRKFQFLAHFPFPAKFIGRIRERIVAIINNYWMRFLWYPE